MILHGFQTARTHEGSGFVTTLPAPTTVLSQIVTPFRIITFAPIRTLFQIIIGADFPHSAFIYISPFLNGWSQDWKNTPGQHIISFQKIIFPSSETLAFMLQNSLIKTLFQISIFPESLAYLHNWKFSQIFINFLSLKIGNHRMIAQEFTFIFNQKSLYQIIFGKESNFIHFPINLLKSILCYKINIIDNSLPSQFSFCIFSPISSELYSILLILYTLYNFYC